MPLRGLGFSVAGLGKIAKRLLDLRIGGGGGGGGGDPEPPPALDVIPDELSFQEVLSVDDVSPCQPFTEDQVTGITEPIVLRMDVTSIVGTPPIIAIRVGSTPYSDDCGTGFGSWSPTLYRADGATFSVNNNDYITVSGYANAPPFPGNDSVSFVIVNTSDGDAELALINLEQTGGCFLTTSVVNYMGLLDNGPELTAMRLLRDRYSTIQGYDSLISEYYENAPKIVEAIGDSPEVYEEIYRSVKICQAFVENENWQAAHDEYFRMYNDLKARYLK